MKEQPDVDNHKLMYHPKRVSEWREAGDCFPVYVEIGPTNRCNHRCIFCALDYLEYGNEFIDRELMISLLKEMAENGVKSIMFAGEGEALLHKDICEFVETAKNLGMDISITTNGVFFNKEKADKILSLLSWLRFSVDAGTRETYSKIHRTKEEDFDRVIENIKYAVKLKKEKNIDTVIGVQFLLIPENIDEVEKAVQVIKETGADNIQIKPYSHHPSSRNNFEIDYSTLEGIGESLKKYNDNNFKVNFRSRTMKRLEEGRSYKECHGLPFFALIDAKGNVIPCNLFYGMKEFTYGNINEKSFSEIWKSKTRKDVIERIKQKGIDVCRGGCRLDPINRYLDRLRNPHSHDNFI